MADQTHDQTDEKEREDKDKVFFAALSAYGNVSKAADAAGWCRAWLYARRAEDEAFAAAWDKALEIGVEALEDEAKRRAYEGWDEPVFYEGVECGAKRKFSDTLLIVLLKAHKPEKYAERQKVESVSNDITPRSPMEVMEELDRMIEDDA